NLASLVEIGQTVVPPRGREIFTWRDLFLILLFIFFSGGSPDHTRRPILTRSVLIRAVLRKEVPFGGFSP
ncbi:MAG TPA: hypothetical protein VIJ25_08910, partial [Methylococcales bacterium]